MIDQADQHLAQWVTGVLGTIAVTLDAPGKPQTGPAVNLYLLEVVPHPPPRGTRRPPLQLALRYLVTTWAEKPEDAHALLGRLAFAAMENPELEVELTPLPYPAWTALGLAPRPSFMLGLPLRQERPEPEVPIVRKPLVIHPVPGVPLYGQVLGPGEVPLPGALIDLPFLQISTRTDARGRFVFANVPADPRTFLLRIQAKGRDQQVTVERPAGDQTPAVIHFDPFGTKEG